MLVTFRYQWYQVTFHIDRVLCDMHVLQPNPWQKERYPLVSYWTWSFIVIKVMLGYPLNIVILHRYVNAHQRLIWCNMLQPAWLAQSLAPGGWDDAAVHLAICHGCNTECSETAWRYRVRGRLEHWQRRRMEMALLPEIHGQICNL